MDASRILEELKEIGAIGAPSAAKLAEALETVEAEKTRPVPEPPRDSKMLRQIDQAILHLSALVEIFQDMRGSLTTETARDLRLVKDEPKPHQQASSPSPADLLSSDPVAYEKARQSALAKIRAEAHLVPDPVNASVVSMQPKHSTKDEDIIASSAENRARPVKESELISLGSAGTRRLDA